MINPLVYLEANNITFTGDMIPAIFDGLKRQTRRPVKGYIINEEPDRYKYHGLDDEGRGCFEDLKHEVTPWLAPIPSNYGKPGDLLWVQEGYQIEDMFKDKVVTGFYTADGEIFDYLLTDDQWEKLINRKYPFRPSPGRFMYKSLCRLVIEIEEVRFEQVQDITPKGVWEEGLRKGVPFNCEHEYVPYDIYPTLYLSEFETLWDSMYAGTEFAWENNPWVEVIKFKPVDLEALKKELSAVSNQQSEGVSV